MQLSAIEIKTMSSQEIATLCNKRHDNVIRTINNLKDDNLILPQFEEVKNQSNQDVKIANLSKRDSLVVVARLSPEFTAIVIDRWQELENLQDDSFQLPQTYSEALRLAADLAEDKALLEAKVESDRPKVEFVEGYVETNDSKCLRDVAKLLGWGPVKFNNQLHIDKIIFKQSGNWVPYSQWNEKGFFNIKTGSMGDKSWLQTRVTPKGIQYLANRYGKIKE